MQLIGLEEGNEARILQNVCKVDYFTIYICTWVY